MSKALVLLGHAEDDSLNAALANAYCAGFREGGGEATLLNLAALHFDPVFRGEAQTLEPDLLDAQRAILAANHLVFVFPTYWGMLPAVVKGFIDRVFLPGFAYRHEGRALPTPLLVGRSARIVTTMDSPSIWYRFAHGRGMHWAMNIATLSYVGIAPRYETTLYSVRNQSREKLTKRVASLQKTARKDALRLARSRPALAQLTA